MPESLKDMRCATCAFRKGTPASNSPITMLKAMLCVEAPELFMCHENTVFITPDGKQYSPLNRNAIDILTKEPQGRYALKPGEELHVCAGWAEAVNIRCAKGFYEQQPEWKRELNQQLLLGG